MLGSRMAELRDALCDAFDAQALTELVRFRLDKDLAEIVPTGAGLSAVAFHLITHASKEGWLPDLVLAACDERPRKQALQAFRSDQEVLAAKLGRIEVQVNEQQQLINKLVETSISAGAFHHLAGLALLRRYFYWDHSHDVTDEFRREFYHLKDRGFIGPERLEFYRELDGTNMVGKAELTETGWIYLKLRKADVPADWLTNQDMRENLKIDVARGLGLEVPS